MAQPAQPGYREYAPPPALEPYVECFWSSVTDVSASQTRHRVLPDGCIDIIFESSLGDYRSGLVVGTMSKAIIFEPDCAVEMLAVRFRPGGVRPFLCLPAHMLTDEKCDQNEACRRGIDSDRIHGAATIRGRLTKLRDALMGLAPHVDRPDERVQVAVAMIKHGNTIEAVARSVDISRQHLNRLFREHVGISPKAFSRIARLRMLVQTIDRRSVDWAASAVSLGYFDQPHMISDCRELTGLTPTQLLRERCASG